MCILFIFFIITKIVNKFYIKKDAQQFDSKEKSFVTLRSKANPQRNCGEVKNKKIKFVLAHDVRAIGDNDTMH